MSRGFEAVSTVRIAAPPSRVWQVLTDPALVREYMHGTLLSTDWRVGSEITWSGEWKGQAYVDRGTVLESKPGERLQYTHWSPMGGTEDVPENYHTVTVQLTEQDGQTELVLTQDNNATETEAETMVRTNWAPMLEALKAIAER